MEVNPQNTAEKRKTRQVKRRIRSPLMLSSTLIDSGTMRNETTEISMAHGPNCITRVTDSGNALEGTSDGRTVRADSVAVGRRRSQVPKNELPVIPEIDFKSDEIRNADENLSAYMPAAIGQSIANASDLLNRTFTTSPCTTSVDIPGNENTSLRRSKRNKTGVDGNSYSDREQSSKRSRLDEANVADSDKLNASELISSIEKIAPILEEKLFPKLYERLLERLLGKIELNQQNPKNLRMARLPTDANWEPINDAVKLKMLDNELANPEYHEAFEKSLLSIAKEPDYNPKYRLRRVVRRIIDQHHLRGYTFKRNMQNGKKIFTDELSRLTAVLKSVMEIVSADGYNFNKNMVDVLNIYDRRRIQGRNHSLIGAQRTTFRPRRKKSDAAPKSTVE